MSPAALHIPCDKCGHRESSWKCTTCNGAFCIDCVLFDPATEQHPMGQVLCLTCYPTSRDQGRPLKLHDRTFGRDRT